MSRYPEKGLLTNMIRGAEEAFISGRRRKQEDVESAVGIFLEILRGFELFDVTAPCVTVFGSSRVAEGTPTYDLARALGAGLAKAGFAVMTGGGPGLMEAANRGAKEAGGISLGCNIQLESEQVPNDYLDDFLEFDHFFVRKLMLIKYSSAFIVMPGGFGTLDEAFEIATLIQTKKLSRFPVVAMGTEFWQPIRKMLVETMVEGNLINARDLDLVTLTDDVEVAIEWVRRGMMENAPNAGQGPRASDPGSG